MAHTQNYMNDLSIISEEGNNNQIFLRNKDSVGIIQEYFDIFQKRNSKSQIRFDTSRQSQGKI